MKIPTLSGYNPAVKFHLQLQLGSLPKERSRAFLNHLSKPFVAIILVFHNAQVVHLEPDPEKDLDACKLVATMPMFLAQCLGSHTPPKQTQTNQVPIGSQ